MTRKKKNPSVEIDACGSDPNSIDKMIGRRIRLQRKILNMSQDDVASMLAITFQQFQKYEIGESKVSASRLYMIGKILGVGVGYFFKPLSPEENAEALKEDAAEEFFVKEDIVNPFDPMKDPEVRQLAYAFMRVGSGKKRRSIAEFVSSMSDSGRRPASDGE